MTLKSALKELKLKLGGLGIVNIDLELGKSELTTILECSLRELVNFIDVPAEITIPYQEVIDLKKLKIDSIMWVCRAEPGQGSISGAGMTDPFYSSTVAVTPGKNMAAGTYATILRTQFQFLVAKMAQNTIQTDLVYQTDYYNKTLKVSYAGMRPSEITIYYRPIIENIEDLPTYFWYDYLMRLALAHSKIILGEIRGKYAVNGSPFSVNADIGAQGQAELTKIREELDSLPKGLGAR